MPPPFHQGSNENSSSARLDDSYMVALDGQDEGQDEPLLPFLSTAELAVPSTTPSWSPEDGIASPSTAHPDDINDWTSGALEGGRGSCGLPSPEDSQLDRLPPEAFPEVHGVGDDDMMDFFLPEVGDFSSEAFSDLDASFSRQQRREPCVRASTCHRAQGVEDSSRGYVGHEDLSKAPLPSIFDDVDLSGFGSQDPAAAPQDRGTHNRIHPGQATTNAYLPNPDSQSLLGPWRRAHPTSLDTGQTSDAAGLNHVQDMLQPSTRHTWDGSMPAASGSAELISRAKAVTAVIDEHCQPLDAVNRHQQPAEVPSKPLVVHKESRLVQLLHTLAQPVTDSSDRLVSLREVNQLQGVTARTSRYKSLYYKNLRVSLPGSVQPQAAAP